MIADDLLHRVRASEGDHERFKYNANAKFHLLCKSAQRCKPPSLSTKDAHDIALLAFMWTMPIVRDSVVWAHHQYDATRRDFLEKMMDSALLLWGPSWESFGLAHEDEWKSWMESF